ncbi:MAG: hypothetical protein ACLVAW_16535 [Eisenbergiella massiliensis]
MALIKCLNVAEISDKAKTCINCGCPLEDVVTSEKLIKMPNNIVEGLVGLFSSRNASVIDTHGNTLWSGKHGENARFTIDEPTKSQFNLAAG